jgi:hypothetical protein
MTNWRCQSKFLSLYRVGGDNEEKVEEKKEA